MEKVVWNERLNIGVEVVDEAHANLFRIAGNLMERVENDRHYRKACKETIKYLENYTMRHFSEEESYMRSIHYKGYEKHKQLHDTFRDQTLVNLKKMLELSGYSSAAVQRFLGVLLGWLTGHIMAEDQAITGEKVQHTMYDYSANTSIVAQAICQAVQEVFRLKAELTDSNYNGQSVGKGFHCRLCYTVDDGSQVELLLAVEEPLIRRGTGMMLGISAMQNEELVNQVSMQIFEQFLNHLGELFKSDSTYQLKKEKLLTADEFRASFMTRYSCNMLFETRLGHFIFCFRKWEAKKRP